jgi:hypothetical protein
MSAPEDPVSLLERLKQQYGVDASDPLHGPSIIVPNRYFKHEWTGLLQSAGYRVYVGESEGKVAWVIPLKPRPGRTISIDKLLINGLPPDSQLPIKNPGSPQDPRSNGATPSTSILQVSQDQTLGRGCIKGRVWTPEEDQVLLSGLKSGNAIKQVSRDLAAKLDRTPSAIETRLLKLRRREPHIVEKAGTSQKPASSLAQPGQEPAASTERAELKSLIESALLLAESPKHLPALKLVLKASRDLLLKG